MTANPSRPSRSLRAALATALAAALALVVPAGAAQSVPRPELTVMTQNLYLGSSLAPALGAETGEELVAAVAEIYGTAVFTDFPARAGAIAAEVAAAEPDLIGLQEVSKWTAAATPLALSADPPSFDFLTILLNALEAEGLHYSVAGVSDNAHIGPLPLIAPAFGCNEITPTPGGLVPDCVVTFDDRDVILVNEGTAGLSVGNARSGRYQAQEVFNTPDGGALSFDRGWVSVSGRYMGKTFRFVNTHLETEDFPDVQEAQAAEFLRGPAKGGQVIATGDFNSAADGSTTTSYAQLTAPPAFTDAWTVNPSDEGLTCCQDSTLTNTTSGFSSRIDLILTRGPIRPLTATVVGDMPFQALPPFWPSDHAGVVATVRIR